MEALQRRVDAAERELGGVLPERVSNGDEGEYPLGLVSFSKALPHNDLGEVDATPTGRCCGRWIAVVGPISRRSRWPGRSSWPIRRGRSGSSRRVRIRGVWCSSRRHGSLPRRSPARWSSVIGWRWPATSPTPGMAMNRSPPRRSPIWRRFDDYRDVDAATLFRSDELAGVNTGPYISQFLVQPYTFGSTPIEQRYVTTVAGNDHLTPMTPGCGCRTAGRVAARRCSIRYRATSATAATWASGPIATSPIKDPWSPP